MSLEDVKFAERGIAGGHNNIQEGIEAFEKLNFEKIYHDGWYDIQIDGDIKEFRHSEVIRVGGFPLPQIIRGIICRSSAERETLLYLLRKKSLNVYNSYKK